VGRGDDIGNEEEEREEEEDEEVNVVTWRFPGDDGEEDDGDGSFAVNGIGGRNNHLNGNNTNGNGVEAGDVPVVTLNGDDDGDEDEWVDEDEDDDGEEDGDDDDDDDEESRAAVDRVLSKYEKAKVFDDDDDDGGFDQRHERKIEEKMTEWKAGYYQVSSPFMHFLYRVKY
jgi:5'-3' exoribonuclease 1